MRELKKCKKQYFKDTCQGHWKAQGPCEKHTTSGSGTTTNLTWATEK